MRKLILLSIAILFGLVISLPTMAQTATSIIDSVHDLSNASFDDGGDNTANNASDRVCVFCHTPHNTVTSSVPLWNHGITTNSFDMYNNTSSPTIDMNISAQPTGVSLACLSCHDGVTALDETLYTPTITSTLSAMTGAAVVGVLSGTNNDLRGEHPISITYDNTATGDTAFKDVGVARTAGVEFFGSTDTVECSSCHAVHEPGTAGVDAPFLRVTTAGSALCLACHTK